MLHSKLRSLPELNIAYCEEDLQWPDEAPVLLVIGSSIYYPRCFSESLRTHCRVIFLDLPHFTLPESSFDPAGFTLDLYMSVVLRACEELSLPKLILIGHSHHGNVALEFAKRHPERLTGLVMIASPPANVAATHAEQSRYWESYASSERVATLQSRRDEFALRGADSMTPLEHYIAAYVSDAPLYWFDMYYNAAGLWSEMSFSMEGLTAFRSFFEDYDFSLETLTIPILVATGRYDFAVPPSLWESLKQAGSNLKYYFFENSGHTPQLEEQVAFDCILLEWLSDNAIG